MNPYISKHAGKCAKAHVVAKLTTKDGQEFVSSNFCLTPQNTCPRETQGYKSGEGYHLCKTVCNQPAHAEENVIYYAKKRGANVFNATIEVDYSWICDGCKDACSKFDIDVKLTSDNYQNKKRNLFNELSEGFDMLKAQKEGNQCDGCKMQHEIKNGLHVDRYGKAYMCCEKRKYERELLK